MNLLQLEGSVDTRDRRIEELEDEVRGLEREILDAKAECAQASRSISNLRRQLTPLYQAFRALFGEMDAIGGSQPEQPSSPRVNAVWESWKQKLGGKPAELIDALLAHGEMNAVQLRVALRCHINTVYETTAKLVKLGILNKNGGKYSLKQL